LHTSEGEGRDKMRGGGILRGKRENRERIERE